MEASLQCEAAVNFSDYVQQCCPYIALQIHLFLHIPPDGAERPTLVICVNGPSLCRIVALSTITGQSTVCGDEPQMGSWLGMLLIETIEILFQSP